MRIDLAARGNAGRSDWRSRRAAQWSGLIYPEAPGRAARRIVGRGPGVVEADALGHARVVSLSLQPFAYKGDTEKVTRYSLANFLISLIYSPIFLHPIPLAS